VVNLNILVTGATGFLGSHIVDELLTNDYQVNALARRTSNTSYLQSLAKVKIINGNLLQIDSLKKAFTDIDLLLHNASVVDEWAPYKYFYENNVQGTQNVLDTVLKSSISKIVYTSSADIYSYSSTEISEEHPRKPRSRYHKSKIAAENLIDSYSELYGLKVTKIRPPGIIGPRNNYMAESVLNGISREQITLIGSGEQIQSYVDPRDVATCIRLALEHENASGETFNVKSFNASVKEYWLSAATHLKKEISFIHYPYTIAYSFGALSEFFGKITRKKTTPRATRFRVNYFGKQHIITDSKVKKMLNYEPKFNLQRSMGEMLDSQIKKRTSKKIDAKVL